MGGAGPSQSGAITTAQLAGRGISEYQIREMVAEGILQRVARGVYVVCGTDGCWRRSLWVGLLRAGPRSFVCRRSAAALWGLDGVDPGFVDVAVGRGHPRWSGAIRLGAAAELEVVGVDGIRATTVERTLVDLGSVVPPTIVERSLESALRRNLVTVDRISDVARSARSGGGNAIREVIDRRGVSVLPTESDAETLFNLIARELGLPDPRRQHLVILRGRKYRLDFAWPELRLAVEIDGASAHGLGELAADLRRQNQILLDGWLVMRFTWHMVARDPLSVKRDLQAAWVTRSVALSWR